jgi:type I restriction enzyme M protein
VTVGFGLVSAFTGYARPGGKCRRDNSSDPPNRRGRGGLDIFWLRDESLEDSANLPDPDVLALEIAEELEAALEQFSAIAEDLKR